MKTKRRKINLKFVLVLMASVAALGVCVHFVHGYQVGRQTGILRQQAEQAEQDGDREKAIGYLSLYLGFRPTDTESLAKFGELLDEEGKRLRSRRVLQHAYGVLGEVLRREPERQAVRRRQADLALDLGEFSAVVEHVNALLKPLREREKDAKSLSDAEKAECADLEGRAGLAEERRKRYADAEDWYRKALDHAPGQPDNHLRLATLYRLHRDAARADQVMKDMITRIATGPGGNKDEVVFQARLTRARYCVRYFPGETGDRRDGLREMTKEDREALEESAATGTEQEVERFIVVADIAARVDDDADEARKVLRDGVKARPESTQLKLALAMVEAVDGQTQVALDLVLRALKDAPDQGDLLHAYADLLIQAGEGNDVEEAGRVIARLRENKAEAPAAVDFLEARLHIRKEEWGQAATILDRIRPQLVTRPQLEAPANLLLARCYERLGNPDQALLAYQQALRLDPVSLVARRGVGLMFMALDRQAEALAEFRQLLGFARRPADTRPLVARLLILRNLRQPAAQRRDWDEVKYELSLAARELEPPANQPPAKQPPSPALSRLQAEVAVLRLEVLLLEDPKRTKEVRDQLREEVKKQPDQVPFWLAVAALEGRTNPVGGALEVLDEAEKKLPAEADKQALQARRLELRLARLSHVVRKPEAEARQALADEEKLASQWTGEGHARMLEGLAASYDLVGAKADAGRLWMEVAKELPNALGPRLVLFNQALREGKDVEARELLPDIKRLEGDRGTLWRFGEAACLVQQAKAESKDGLTAAGKRQLAEARDHLAEAAKLRPSWYRVPALQGDIADLEGNVPAAVERYQQAVSLGDRRPVVVRRLTAHLSELKRWPDLLKITKELEGQDQLLLDAGLGKLDALAKLGTGDRDGAVQVAEKAVSPDSKRYEDQLFLAQIYASTTDRKEDAEKALRQACELGASVPDTWVWLVSYLAGTGQKPKAEAAIEQARKALPPDQAALALAACYAAVGNAELAEKHYQEALEKQPDDPKVLRNVAAYYVVRGQPQKAEPLLRKMIASARGGELAWARRALASMLASAVNRPKYEEGLKLIDLNLKDDRGSLADRRAKAMLLATRTYQRKEAIRLLEELRSEQPLTAEEHFALFRLYDTDGDWEKARAAMLLLLDSPEGRQNNVPYGTRYVRRLIQRGQLEEAAQQLKALQNLSKEPKTKAPVVSELEARLLHARGKRIEAMAAIQEYGNAKDVDPSAAGLLAEEFSQEGDENVRTGYRNEAEDLYKKSLKHSQAPARHLVLAGFYGRQGRIDEALNFCEEAGREKAAPDAVGAVMVAVLRGGQPKPEEFDRVDRWLREAVGKGDSNGLAVPLADLRDLQGRYGDAVDLYQGALTKNPNNLLAINNLAWLLALKEGKGIDALAMVNRGIELVGPSPELLDTRGVIYLTLGRPAEAIKDLQDCIEQAPSALRYFHLAQAQQLAKNRAAASDAMGKAEKSGLQSRQLHPLEREAYKNLKAGLGNG
jgi:tetratricopeptide (TPR) repeat protein